MAEDAGHGDDGALASADHGGEEAFERVVAAENIDAEGLLDIFNGEVEEGFAIDDGGVVDENCGCTELGLSA